MREVTSKTELQEALKARETRIIVSGDLAVRMRKATKVKKAGKIGGLVLVVGGIIAIPFTAGASSGVVAAGLAATALTVGTVTISATELAILCGLALGLAGIRSGAEVTYNPDGTVTIKPKY